MADSEDKKSTLRWIDAARYVIAGVVAVLITAVIVNAIEVVLRRETLSLSVVGGAVFVRRSAPAPAPPRLFFDFNLEADNPSGRARMYYTGIIGYLFDNSTSPVTPSPGNDSIMYFRMDDKSVEQQRRVNAFKEVEVRRGKDIVEPLFDMFFNRTDAAMTGVTLRLDGNLTTEVRSGYNSTISPTTYLCGPLLVGGEQEDEAYQSMQDVSCTEQPSKI